MDGRHKWRSASSKLSSLGCSCSDWMLRISSSIWPLIIDSYLHVLIYSLLNNSTVSTVYMLHSSRHKNECCTRHSISMSNEPEEHDPVCGHIIQPTQRHLHKSTHTCCTVSRHLPTTTISGWWLRIRSCPKSTSQWYFPVSPVFTFLKVIPAFPTCEILPLYDGVVIKALLFSFSPM